MNHSTHEPSTQTIMTKLRRMMASKQGLTAIRLTISYIVLILGAAFMLFPIIWMVSASLKPDWQIFIQPIIWIPQEWFSTPAGNTGQDLNLWTASLPSEEDAEDVTQDVIKIEARRYAPAVLVNALSPIAVPKDQVSDAEPQELGDVILNIRQWDHEDGQQDVVALAVKGDTLLVVPVEEVEASFVLPLDQINTGERSTYEVDDDFTLKTRHVTLDDGTSQEILQLSPTFQTITIVPFEVAQEALLVPLETVSALGLQPIGQTEINLYTLEGDDAEARYIEISRAAWSPALDEHTLREHAFTIPIDRLTIEDEPQLFGLAKLSVATYIDDAGEAQTVALLLSNPAGLYLVIPVTELSNLRLLPMDSLMRPFPEDVDGMSVRFKDYTLDGEELRVGILGQRQDMSMLIPAAALEDIYEVPGEIVKRKTRPSLQVENYLDAMQSELAGENFVTFFKNSIIIVTLSIVGHMFSCTITAYGFARMRAPGKRVLFGILLATMMLPFPVTLVPVYEIFRDLSMIDTLWPMFIRAFFGHPFLIFLLRQFYTTIPKELEEAAIIDGATRIDIFLRIILPLTKPAMATLAIFTFTWRWNDLFGAIIFLNSPENYTVAIGLNAFKGAYEADFHLLMAAAVIVMMPTVLLFFFAQRFFIEGITLTGLKG